MEPPLAIDSEVRPARRETRGSAPHPPEVLEALARVPVDRLGLPPRIREALRRNDNHSVEALLRLAHVRGLTFLRGIGPEGAKVIERALGRELPRLLPAIERGDPTLRAHGRAVFGHEDRERDWALRSLPIEVLKLDTRTRGALRRRGLRWIGDLVDVGRIAGVTAVRGVGPVLGREAERALIELCERTYQATAAGIGRLASPTSLQRLAEGDPWLEQLVRGCADAPPTRLGRCEAWTIPAEARPFLEDAAAHLTGWIVEPDRILVRAWRAGTFDLRIHRGDDLHVLAVLVLGGGLVLTLRQDFMDDPPLRLVPLGFGRGPHVIAAAVASLVDAAPTAGWRWAVDQDADIWIESRLEPLETLRVALAMDERATAEVLTRNDDEILAWQPPGGEPRLVPMLAWPTRTMLAYRSSVAVAAARTPAARTLADQIPVARRLLVAKHAGRVREYGPCRAWIVDDPAMEPFLRKGAWPIEEEADRLERSGDLEHLLVPDDEFTIDWGMKVDEFDAIDGVEAYASLQCIRLDRLTYAVFWYERRHNSEEEEFVVGFGEGPDPVRACAAVLIAAPPLGGITWDETVYEQGGTFTQLGREALYRLMLAATGRAGEELLDLSDEALRSYRIPGVELDWAGIAYFTEQVWWGWAR